jgi:hypothetical protein
MKDDLLVRVAMMLHHAMITQNVRVKHLAKRARIRRKRLKQYLRAEKDMDLRTLSDLMFYLGRKFVFNFVPKDIPQNEPVAGDSTKDSPEQPDSPAEATP